MWNHRRELRIAERRQGTRTAKQQERKDERRTGAKADDLAARTNLAGRGRPDRTEYAGPDDGTDRQHHEIAGTEHALERLLAVGYESGDTLAADELPHRNKLRQV